MLQRRDIFMNGTRHWKRAGKSWGVYDLRMVIAKRPPPGAAISSPQAVVDHPRRQDAEIEAVFPFKVLEHRPRDEVRRLKAL